jgi:predicted RNA-binding Zn-ribbon protein involved in translation (DUF1610 family)
MTDETPRPAPILNTQGQPARTAKTEACPQCGAGPTSRIASCGFGVRRPVCGVCGYKLEDEVFVD